MKKKQLPLVRRDPRGTGGGTPYVVLPDGLELIRKMAAQGNDQLTIARALNIAPSTMTSLVKRQQKVQEALDCGHAELADELTHHLLTAARKGNVIAAIYLTKTRLGWREGDPPETRTNIVINLPDSQTPEAYMKTVRALELPAPAKENGHA